MFFKLIREFFFLILVLYLIAGTITTWNHYSSCFAPIHTFLITVYIFILISRLIRIFIKGTYFLHKFFYPVLALITIQGITYQLLNNIYSPTCGSELGQKFTGGQVWAALVLLLMANMGTVLMALGNCMISLLYNLFEMRMESVMHEVNTIMVTQDILLTGGIRSGYKECKGLSNQEIGKIQEVMRSSLLEDKFKQETCSVCYEDFKKGDEKCVLPVCNHMFHVNCVKQWLSKCPICPMCRSNVRVNLAVESLNNQQAVNQV